MYKGYLGVRRSIKNTEKGLNRLRKPVSKLGGIVKLPPNYHPLV